MGFFDKAKEAVGFKSSQQEVLQQEEETESFTESFGTVCPKLTFQQVSYYVGDSSKECYIIRTVVVHVLSHTIN